MAETAATRCGYVALVGAPNAGKSTLLNTLVGAKVSIVSRKVQTTRTRVLGIGLVDAAQLIWVDTPGIFAPQRRLERAMVRAAWQGAEDADAVVLLHDAARAGIDDDTRAIIDRLRAAGRSAVLALNKVDLVRRETLLARSAELNALGDFARTFMISALTGDGVEDLKAYLAQQMPEGPWLFDPEQLSDMPERLLAAELTREQLFDRLHAELPYSITVETEDWQDFDDGSVRIEQTIYVLRDSQKGIVLGHKGERIQAVRKAVQAELQELLERRVHLFLRVKVRPRWLEEPARYRVWGLDFED